MIPRVNFHTHTTFCDGNNTAEEMVIEAIRKGFEELGFSGHAYTPFDESYCMSKEKTRQYRAEIARLKDKYSDKIKIYCGLEVDYFSEADENDYDFLIGSVHYVEKNGIYYPIDESEERFLYILNEVFNGNAAELIKAYYSLVGDVINKTGAHIIGHFDLITKYNEGDRLFPQGSEYIAYAREAVEKLSLTGKVFEINTGAIARGLRTTPYPAPSILKIFKEHNMRGILSSDCHSKEALDFAFDKAKKLADENKITLVTKFSRLY